MLYSGHSVLHQQAFIFFVIWFSFQIFIFDAFLQSKQAWAVSFPSAHGLVVILFVVFGIGFLLVMLLNHTYKVAIVCLHQNVLIYLQMLFLI